LSSCSARSAKRAVEGAALANADILQRLGQGFGVELLQTNEADRGNDGALLDQHHHRAAVDLDANVLVEPGGEQRTQGRRAFLVGVLVTDAKRQAGEHRTGIGALQALDADVAKLKRLDSPGRGLQGATEEQGEQGRMKARARAFGSRHQAGGLRQTGAWERRSGDAAGQRSHRSADGRGASGGGAS
jgi:hypothetical protein